MVGQVCPLVEELDPVVVAEPEVVVGAGVVDGQRLPADEDGGDDGSVVARPLEGGGGEITGCVDLDPVELVLEPPVSGGGRQDARPLPGVDDRRLRRDRVRGGAGGTNAPQSAPASTRWSLTCQVTRARDAVSGPPRAFSRIEGSSTAE